MAETKFIQGQRDQFFEALFPIFKADRNCVIITADNGAPSLDQFYKELPDQFFQVGIAEQQMVGMAAGMAIEGKKVYCYAIAPFVTTRVHEFVKLDMCSMNLPVTLLGVGAGYAYDIMGPSHHTVEDISIMRCLPNLTIWGPADGAFAYRLAKETYERSGPQYVRFDRAGVKDVYASKEVNWLDFSAGMCTIEQVRANSLLAGSGRTWDQAVLVTTGSMLRQALAVADALALKGIDTVVVDVYRLKPFNAELFLRLIDKTSTVVTIEEHYLAGGLGSIVAECMVDNFRKQNLIRMGRDDRFCFEYGGRQAVWADSGLDVASIVSRVEEELSV